MKKVIEFLKKDLSIVIICAVLSLLVWVPSSFLGLHSRIYMMFASWIWMFCLLICERKVKRFWGYFIFFAGLWISSTFVHYGLYGTGVIEFIPNLLCSLIIFPAFLVDSILNKKYNKFYFTLVFPAVYVVLSIIMSLLNIGVCFRFDMFSSILIVPYQIVSIIGAYGLTFVFAWIFVSILYIVKNIKNINKLKISIICPIVMVGILVFGCVRYYTASQPNFTFKIAYAVGPYRGDFIDSEDVTYEEHVEYFTTTCKEASEKGATLIAYTEEAFYFKGNDGAIFTELVKEEAKKNNISILMCMELELNEETSENKILWVDSKGEIKISYLKNHLIPVLEEEFKSGERVIPYVDFDIDGHNVRISTCICYDSDDPLYTYKMNHDTDVFIVPCWDWNLIQEKHTNSTAYIPLQNHVTFVKLTYDGWSSVVDKYGKQHYSEKLDVHDTGVKLIDIPVF